MNLQFVLEALQNLRTRIDAWGLTTESLWIAAAVAAVFFLLSFREVITWFLKMSHLREELRELREENAAMRTSIDQIHAPFRNRPPRFRRPRRKPWKRPSASRSITDLL
ncbi:MAG TPA: hypothetical protein PKC28_10050 [Bdellovibrionales bacterium]|nr:hypothetical protein [Bdellovibrionales bacterium]